MTKIRKMLLSSVIALILFTALNIAQQHLEQTALAVNNDRMAPQFVVDPYWPQPLANKWLLGRTIGIAIDERDHLYVVHRDQDSISGTVTTTTRKSYMRHQTSHWNAFAIWSQCVNMCLKLRKMTLALQHCQKHNHKVRRKKPHQGNSIKQ